MKFAHDPPMHSGKVLLDINALAAVPAVDGTSAMNKACNTGGEKLTTNEGIAAPIAIIVEAT